MLNENIVGQIKKMWASGLSARSIAEELDLTREDVMAVVQGGPSLVPSAKPMAELPVKKPPAPSVKRAKHPPKPKTATTKSPQYLFGKGPGTTMDGPPMIKAEPVTEGDSLVIPLHQRCTLLELEAWQCKWPYGTPGHEDFFFCGGERIEGCSYCEYHARLAYQPAAARRARPSIPAGAFSAHIIE